MPRPMPPSCRQFMHTNARHMLATFCLMKPKLLGGHRCVSVYVRKTLSACVCVCACVSVLKACMWKNSFWMNASFNPWNMIWVQIFCITMSSTLPHMYTHTHTRAQSLAVCPRGRGLCVCVCVSRFCLPRDVSSDTISFYSVCMCVCVHLYLPTANTSLAWRLPSVPGPTGQQSNISRYCSCSFSDYQCPAQRISIPLALPVRSFLQLLAVFKCICPRIHWCSFGGSVVHF